MSASRVGKLAAVRLIETELSGGPILIEQSGRDLSKCRPRPKLAKYGTGTGVDARATHHHPLSFAQRANYDPHDSLIYDAVDDG